MLDAAAPVPAIVVKAAQRTQAAQRGIVGLRLHRVFDVHAGPYHRHDDLQFAAVYQDGTLVKVRILSQQIGGKDADAAANAQTAQKYEHPAPADVFRAPFDPRYLQDYSYEQVDAATVRFKTLVRDSAHGDGTFTVDPAGHVTAYRYSPAAMPQYAKTGTVSGSRAPVLPGYWATTKETQQYSGRYAIFGGGADVSIEQSGFVRFSALDQALSALAAGRF